MNRRFFNFLLKFGVIVAAYVVAAQYIGDTNILYVTIAISAGYILVSLLSKKDPMVELKRYSHAANFMRKSEKTFAKNKTKKAVYLAYGLLYDGKIEDSKASLELIDVEALKSDAATYHLYIQTLLRHEYEDGNLEQVEYLFKVISTEAEIHPNTENIAELMILMLNKKYQDALNLMLELIPKEDRRHVIMELELMLAKLYVQLEQKEDAKAVLKFVASRKFHTVHIEKAKSMLVEL